MPSTQTFRVENWPLGADDDEVPPLMSLADAHENLKAWRSDYNGDKPHSAIGNKAPITLTKSGDTTSLSP